MTEKTLGYLGLGSIGFPICYGLFTSGHQLVLPAYRRDSAQARGFSTLVPDAVRKASLMDEMLCNGAKGAGSLRELVQSSDIILMCLPTSEQVEEIVLSPEGILENAKAGTIVIDMTSAAPASTQRLSKLLEAKGIELLDAPISGGTAKAISQTLTIMVGGKEEVFEQCIPLFETIGAKENVYYVGPSGAGHTIKCANNFLSACCAAATTEAVMVAAKAGISPQKAIEVINVSGGKNSATMNIYPNIVFPGNYYDFTIDLLCKDINQFNEIAKKMKVPAFISNTVYQLWNIPSVRGEGNEDCTNLMKMYEDWCGIKVRGITRK